MGRTESSRQGLRSRPPTPRDPLLDVSSLLYNVFTLMPPPRPHHAGSGECVCVCVRAWHTLRFFFFLTKKRKERKAKAHQALQRFLQSDDRIESLRISGVPPLAPGSRCHYACLQSCELNALAGSAGGEGRGLGLGREGGRERGYERLGSSLMFGAL